jgi:hypothetical protein
MLGCGRHGRPHVRRAIRGHDSSRPQTAELEAQGITRPCPAREIIITDAISKAEEIMRKIEKNYPAKC